MEKAEIKIDVEYFKNLVLQQMPTDPPRTIDGKDISLEEIEKELLEHYGLEK